ncbi:MAG: integrase [Pseudomonadota bacterium]
MVAVEPEWMAMVLTGRETGLRLGERLALRWQEVGLVAGRLVVRRSDGRALIGAPKNGKSREVPLRDEARSMLRRHRHMMGELLFCREDGAMLKAEQCRAPSKRACKNAGPRRVSWKTLLRDTPPRRVRRHGTRKAHENKSPRESLGFSGASW